MKKILSFMAIVVILASVGTTVFAASPGTSKLDDRIAKLQQQQQQIESKVQSNESKASVYQSKMSQYDAYKQQLAQDRITAINNGDENLQLVAGNKQLRASLAAAIEAVRKNGTQLSADTLAALKTDNQQIQSIWKDIASTKGQIKSITAQNKNVIKNQDYTTLDANFQQIYTIQSWRNEQLQQINSILQQMNSLLSGTSAGSSSQA